MYNLQFCLCEPFNEVDREQSNVALNSYRIIMIYFSHHMYLESSVELVAYPAPCCDPTFDTIRSPDM